MLGRLGIVTAVVVAVLGGQVALAQEEIPEGLLGEFTFIGDGVIEFTLEGDEIIGTVTQVPTFTGIDLVGGQPPCGEFADEIVFRLDRTGVGEWFWFSAGPCTLLGGAPVTVEFTAIGATATGDRPESHPDFDGIPQSHAMVRVTPLSSQITTTTAAPETTTSTEVTTTTTEPEEVIVVGVNDQETIVGGVLAITGLILLLGGGLWYLRRRFRLPNEPCECDARIEIDGPGTASICCWNPSYSLRTVETAEGGQRDPHAIHLDADVEGRENWDLFDRIFRARIVPRCHGGGRLLVDQAAVHWAIAAEDDQGITLSFTASIPMQCPDGQERPPLVVEGQHRLEYVKATCWVGVLYRVGPFDEVSHIDVHILCGDYSEVFGYGPADPSANFASTILGTSGKVTRVRNDEPTKQNHMTRPLIGRWIGKDYSALYPGRDLSVYWFEVEDCRKCDALRNEWEILHARPGTYWLTDNNCATQADKTLAVAGIVAQEPMTAPTPSGVARRLDRIGSGMLGEGVTAHPKQEIRR